MNADGRFLMKAENKTMKTIITSNWRPLHRAQNRMEEARKAFEEALQIYEAFAKEDPDQFSTDVTRVNKLLAELPK
jgi:hypothetical protein